MSGILLDENVSDNEDVHQSDLQRALDLGYDEYLRIVRESIRPLVDRILSDARSPDPNSRRDHAIRRLQALQTVVKIDYDTLEAIWPE